MTGTGNVSQKNRVMSIDIARGIIMVIMALDHVRDFFHRDALAFDPTDLTKTSPALFFTRWITHFCAPTFILLAGVSIFLSQQRKSKKELSRFLLLRGLWLVIIELTIMRFAFFFNFYYDVTILNIMWVIGLCMIAMSAIVWLRDQWILIGAFLLIALHNATGDTIPVLTRVGFISLSPSVGFMIAYPLLPWLGIMMAGYALGSLYRPEYDAAKRQRLLFLLGISSFFLFVVLRLINNYGDPAPWSNQSNLTFTFLSFLNVTKYPASLLFTLMTLGPVMLLLAVLENLRFSKASPFNVFGRVPLFYFILHFYMAHAIALWLYILNTGKPLSEIDFHFSKSFGGLTPEGGFSLPWVYLFWITVVIAIYPFCYWYNYYKTTSNRWWLSYL